MSKTALKIDRETLRELVFTNLDRISETVRICLVEDYDYGDPGNVDLKVNYIVDRPAFWREIGRRVRKLEAEDTGING